MIKLIKCKFCNREAQRNHANHKTGELEDMCMIHYAEKVENMQKEDLIIDGKNMDKFQEAD